MEVCLAGAVCSMSSVQVFVRGRAALLVLAMMLFFSVMASASLAYTVEGRTSRVLHLTRAM
jgi:hypothetical protein